MSHKFVTNILKYAIAHSLHQGLFCIWAKPMRDDDVNNVTSSLIGKAHKQNDPCSSQHPAHVLYFPPLFCMHNMCKQLQISWWQ